MIGGAKNQFFVLIAFALTVYGLCLKWAVEPINPIALTVEQEIVPVKMGARVFGVCGAGSLAGILVGVLLCGYAHGWIGLLPALFVMGSCYLTVTGSLLVNPAIKDMEISGTGKIFDGRRALWKLITNFASYNDCVEGIGGPLSHGHTSMVIHVSRLGHGSWRPFVCGAADGFT